MDDIKTTGDNDRAWTESCNCVWSTMRNRAIDYIAWENADMSKRLSLDNHNVEIIADLQWIQWA